MRIIKKEHIITTVFNKDFSIIDGDDLETVRIIFKNLQEHRVEFSTIIFQPTSIIGEHIRLSYDKVRVLKIHEDDTVDLLVIKKGTNMKMNKVLFENINEVDILTKKHKILDVINDVTRFDLLDL